MNAKEVLEIVKRPGASVDEMIVAAKTMVSVEMRKNHVEHFGQNEVWWEIAGVIENLSLSEEQLLSYAELANHTDVWRKVTNFYAYTKGKKEIGKIVAILKRREAEGDSGWNEDLVEAPWTAEDVRELKSAMPTDHAPWILFVNHKEIPVTEKLQALLKEQEATKRNEGVSETVLDDLIKGSFHEFLCCYPDIKHNAEDVQQALALLHPIEEHFVFWDPFLQTGLLSIEQVIDAAHKWGGTWVWRLHFNGNGTSTEDAVLLAEKHKDPWLCAAVVVGEAGTPSEEQVDRILALGVDFADKLPSATA